MVVVVVLGRCGSGKGRCGSGKSSRCCGMGSGGGSIG